MYQGRHQEEIQEDRNFIGQQMYQIHSELLCNDSSVGKTVVSRPSPTSATWVRVQIMYADIVGNPIGKKTLTFTFDGKIEYIILPVLILFLDMWQNTYGWMPSLWLLLSCRNRSKVNWVQNIIYFATDTDSLYFVNLIMTRVCQYYIKILDVHLWCHIEFTRLSMHDIYLGQRSFKYTK